MKKVISIFLFFTVIIFLLIGVSAEEKVNKDSDSTLIYGGLYPEEIPSEQEQFETFLKSKNRSQNASEVWDKIRGAHSQTVSTRDGA